MNFCFVIAMCQFPRGETTNLRMHAADDRNKHKLKLKQCVGHGYGYGSGSGVNFQNGDGGLTDQNGESFTPYFQYL